MKFSAIRASSPRPLTCIHLALAVLFSTPLHAALPSVEAVIHFTGARVDSNGNAIGNGAFPPAGRGNVFAPYRSLAEGADGYLYGFTPYGGGPTLDRDGGAGRVFFRYRADTGQETLARTTTYEGHTSNFSPFFASDGQLYSSMGGLSRYTPGAGWQTLVSTSVRAGWVEGADGRFFGHAFDQRIVAVNKDGVGGLTAAYTVPESTLYDPVVYLSHSNGRLYGVGGFPTSLFSIKPDGSDFLVLHPNVDALPSAMLEGTDGRIYGAIGGGGANTTGSLFRIDADGANYTVLYEFAGDNANISGIRPNALTLAKDGHVYGTATTGGINGNGVIFRWNTENNSYQPLYAFTAYDQTYPGISGGRNTGSNSDGRQPYGLMQASDGSFYGMASLGGQHGWGTVFKFTPGDEVPVFVYEPRMALTVTANYQTAASATIGLGPAVELNWRGQLVNNCVASSNEPGSSWTGSRTVTGGPESITPAAIGNWTYTLTCDSTSAERPDPVSQSVTVTVLSPDSPTERAGNGGGAFTLAFALLPLLGAGLWLRRRRA